MSYYIKPMKSIEWRVQGATLMVGQRNLVSPPTAKPVGSTHGHHWALQTTRCDATNGAAMHGDLASLLVYHYG